MDAVTTSQPLQFRQMEPWSPSAPSKVCPLVRQGSFHGKHRICLYSDMSLKNGPSGSYQRVHSLFMNCKNVKSSTSRWVHRCFLPGRRRHLESSLDFIRQY